ncbi:MAG: PilZ domain-containing protein [Sphingomicrobium sp.]
MNIRKQIYGETGLQESPLVCVKKPRGAKPGMLHSIPVVRAQRRHGDTRVQDRFHIVDERARVTHAGSKYDAKLRNICASGAMVAADFEPVPWDRMTLELGDHRPIKCAVLWVKEGRIGLEFAEPIRLDCADKEKAGVRDMIERHFPDAKFEAPVEPQRQTARAAPIGEEQRLERRNPLIRMGTLHYDYQSTPARLRNISTSGATLETSAALVPGAEPLLDLGEAGSIFATVVWKSGDHAGLRFNQPFDLAQLPKAHAPSETASWQPPAYLRTNAHCDNRWADDVQRRSLGDINEVLGGFLKR